MFKIFIPQVTINFANKDFRSPFVLKWRDCLFQKQVGSDSQISAPPPSNIKSAAIPNPVNILGIQSQIQIQPSNVF